MNKKDVLQKGKEEKEAKDASVGDCRAKKIEKEGSEEGSCRAIKTLPSSKKRKKKKKQNVSRIAIPAGRLIELMCSVIFRMIIIVAVGDGGANENGNIRTGCQDPINQLHAPQCV